MTTTRREVLTVEEYRAEVLTLLPGPTGAEEVAVPDAAGRVLAEPARAAGAAAAAAGRPWRACSLSSWPAADVAPR